eukprot:TRINITY_DN3866_c0_g1_i1.p1 TRINITY_DN3866_c0_g1~~TRINITY_DN3866_c0_g1_i1.p1  ORF type:complete len:486 (+),score=94.67 TRINITY_DN3866_c0_g1_i1:23-1459(+)
MGRTKQTASEEGPKKARTAYIFFSMENFKKLAQSYSGPEIYSQLSKQWKEISPSEKARLEALAEEDTRRYKREMELFHAGKFVPAPDDKPRKRKQEGPKKPLHAYQLFVRAKKCELRGTLPHAQVWDEISRQWKALGPTDKQKWQEQAALEKKRYVLELEAFHRGEAIESKRDEDEEEEEEEEDAEAAEDEEEEAPPKKKAKAPAKKPATPKTPAPKAVPKVKAKPAPAEKAKPKAKAKPQADSSSGSSSSEEDDGSGFRTEKIETDSKRFWKVEDKFNSALQGTNPDYVKNRIVAGKKPVKFKLKEVLRVHNPPLEKAFHKKKDEFRAAGIEIRERVSFHSTHPKNVDSIVRTNLLPFGHPTNPCKQQSDSGWFGSNRKGVYVSKYAEYTFKYGNRLCPMDPGDMVSVIMFKTLPGKCKLIETLSAGIDPTPGYNSHSSPNNIEWYIFDSDQILPEYIIKVQAFEDTRDVADDGLAS